MATADELYLLFQQHSDFQKEKIADWEKHFIWLEEVVSHSNEAWGQSVLPKTPMTTRKVKKIKVELNHKEAKEDAFCSFSVPSNPGLRKSSRAAAKTATMKIGRTLEDISNLQSKLRRPSSPKKVTFTPPKEQPEVPCQVTIVDNANNSNRCSDIEEISESEPELLCFKEEKTGDLLSQRKSTAQSCRSDSGIGTEKHELDFESDNAKRQSLKGVNVEEKVAVQQTAIVTQIIEHDKIIMPPPPNWSGPPEVMSKVDTDTNKNTEPVDQLEEEIKKPVRLTRTKKRLVEEKDVEEQQQQPVRVTRTKKRKIEEEEVENSSTILKDKHILVSNDCASEIHQVTEASKRVTRSKVKQINKTNSPLHGAQSNGTTPKQNNSGVSSPRSGNRIKSSKPGTQTNSPLINSFPNNSFRKHVPSIRITEVEEVSLSDTDVMQSPVKVVKHSAISDKYSTCGKAPLSSQQYQTPTQSSLYKARIHGLHNSKNNHLHSNTSVLSSGSLHSMLSQKRTFLSSSSPNISSSRILGTPAEAIKTKNLISGVNSFITKVQPSKPTKEESEERKLEELRRKNKRVEETKRKKEEFLKHKVEEQKRKNEERMRRVQEAREARDKKVLEARQLQEQEQKLKEERLKEEKKKLISAKRKEELAKIQRIKEQEDKQRQRKIEEKHRDELRRAEEKQKEELKKAELREKEEQKKIEEKVKEEQRKAEEKLKEERRKAEEELQMAIERKKEEQQQMERLRNAEKKQQEELKRAEEKRLKLEEQKQLMEQKRVKEQCAKEEYERQKMKERERIERERRELQLLREKEEAAKSENPNSTFTLETKNIANTTYTKPLETPNADSYEITPVAKKASKKKRSNPDDYDVHNLCSEDSTDDAEAPKKNIPKWAEKKHLHQALFSQEYNPPNICAIFPFEELLTKPDLSTIFSVKNREQKIKYSKRTSSATWDTPPFKSGGQR